MTIDLLIEDLNQRGDFLCDRRTALLNYLKSCLAEEDFHGVSDAANDLREVDTELSLVNKTLDKIRLIQQPLF